MNKILTRIATAFVGIAMAVGVGVAVGNNSKQVQKVEAAVSVSPTMAAGTNGSVAYVNGSQAIKVGTSSAGGDMSITVAAGTTELYFFAAAWSGVTNLSLNLTGATATVTSFALTADTGISNSSPFTLSGDEEDYLFSTTLSNIAEATTITLTSSAKKRFVVWGPYYASSSNSVKYSVVSSTVVAASGRKPFDATHTYSQTGTNAGQMTEGNNLTLTISGYGGKKITEAYVSVKSNSNKGTGSLSLVAGAKTIASIADSKFNTANWNGAWSTSFVTKELSVTETKVGDDADIVLSMSASENSIYLEWLSITWEEASEEQTPDLSFDDSDVALVLTTSASASRTLTYEYLTNGVAAISSNTDVATCSVSSAVTGNDTTGTKTLTITAVAEGYAEIEVSAESGALGSIISVSVSQTRTYTKATKLAQIVSGVEAVFITESGNHALSSIASGNFLRGETVTTISNGVATVSNISVNRVVLTKITEGTYSGYYTLKDVFTNKYLYRSSTNLKEADSLSANDNYYWSFSFATGQSDTICKVISKADSTRYIRWNDGNSAKYFGCYQDSTSSSIDICMYLSSIPQEVELDSISGSTSTTVEAGSSIQYAGTYLPANASESILNMADDGLTISNFEMDGNGHFTATISAAANMSAADDYVIMFYGENEKEGVALELTIAVTTYEPTHMLVEDEDDLFNGARVIIANPTNDKVASVQATNNVTAGDARIEEDDGSLSNATGNGIDYIVWKVTYTVQGETPTNYTGWIFYNNGGYLAATGSGNNNLLKSQAKLTEKCVFSLAFDESGNATITCLGNSENNIMRYNSNSGAFSCYPSTSGVNGIVQLYCRIDEATTAQLSASGYEYAFLRLDGTIPTSNENDTNECRESNNGYGYYFRAKENYSGLVDGAVLSADANARLSAWADANGETFENGVFSAKQGALIVRTNLDGNSMTTTIVLVAIISTVAVGAFFIIRKKKEQ